MSVAERQLMALLCSQWQHRGNAVQPPCFLDPGPKDQAAPRNHAELAQVLSKTVNGSFRTPVVLTSWTVLHFQVSKASSRLRILDPLWATRSWLREAALGSFGASCLQWWFSAARLWQSYLLCLCNGFSSLALSAPLLCAPWPVWVSSRAGTLRVRCEFLPRPLKLPLCSMPDTWAPLVESSAFTRCSGRRDPQSLQTDLPAPHLFPHQFCLYLLN